MSFLDLANKADNISGLCSQAIIRSILISGRLGPNIKHIGCYGLLLKHLKSEELHWLHPDLTVGEVEQRYESHHVEAEWRYDAPPNSPCRFFII